jgi:molybdopterin-guanine dinucleotide biosynthesis protein A
LLNANGDPARFARFTLPVIPDTVEDYPGPLAGVLAGLDWTAANRPDAEWVVSVAGDCPFLPRDLVARLHRARAAGLGFIPLAGEHYDFALVSSRAGRPAVQAFLAALASSETHAALAQAGFARPAQSAP